MQNVGRLTVGNAPAAQEAHADLASLRARPARANEVYERRR